MHRTTVRDGAVGSTHGTCCNAAQCSGGAEPSTETPYGAGGGSVYALGGARSCRRTSPEVTAPTKHDIRAGAVRRTSAIKFSA